MTALLLLCASANAATPTSVTVDAHITPVIRAFTTKTTPSTLAINLTFAPDTQGDYAAALTQAVINFSYGAIAYAGFYVGSDWQRLLATMREYGTIAAIAAAILLTIGALVWWLKPRMSRG